MTDVNWKTVGGIVQERRRWIGLSQEDLQQYGGPGKTSVSKIERGVMAPFTVPAQQQLERVLGWPRGAIRDMYSALERSGANGETIGVEYVEMPPPDLAALRNETAPDTSPPLDHISDLALVAELTRRLARSAETTKETPNDNPASNTQAGRARHQDFTLAADDLTRTETEGDAERGLSGED